MKVEEAEATKSYQIGLDYFEKTQEQLATITDITSQTHATAIESAQVLSGLANSSTSDFARALALFETLSTRVDDLATGSNIDAFKRHVSERLEVCRSETAQSALSLEARLHASGNAAHSLAAAQEEIAALKADNVKLGVALQNSTAKQAEMFEENQQLRSVASSRKSEAESKVSPMTPPASPGMQPPSMSAARLIASIFHYVLHAKTALESGGCMGEGCTRARAHLDDAVGLHQQWDRMNLSVRRNSK